MSLPGPSREHLYDADRPMGHDVATWYALKPVDPAEAMRPALRRWFVREAAWREHRRITRWRERRAR